MSTLATLVVKLRAEIGDFVKGMDDAERQVSKVAKTFTRTGKEMSEGLTLPIVGAGALFFKFAADAEVTERRFGLAFGSMSEQARAFSEKLAKDLGLSAEGIRDAMTPVEQTLKAMGFSAQSATSMSEGLVKLAEDLSVTSGAGRSVDDIMQSLTRGLAGSTRGLKDLGIVISPAVEKAYALQHGLLGLHDQLSVGNKAFITYQMILQQTANLQGSFAKNLNDPLVMLRQLREQAGDVARELGISLMPAFKTLLGIGHDLAVKIQELADWFTKLPQGWRDVIVYAGAAVAAVGPLVFVFGKVVSGVTGLISILGLLKNTLVFLVTNPIGQTILAIGILTGVVIKLSDYTNWMKEQVVLAWTATVDFIERAAIRILNALGTMFDILNKPILAAGARAAAAAITTANEHLLASTATTLTRLESMYDASGRNIRSHAAAIVPGAPAANTAIPTISAPGGNISTLPTQAERVAEALRKMDEQMRISALGGSLLGETYNAAAARAAELKKAFDEIAATGVSADQVLNANGLTLRKLGLAYQQATRDARRFMDVGAEVSRGVSNVIGSMAAALGKTIVSGGNLFKALGNALLQGLGAVATSIGQKLIEMGTLLKLAFTLSPSAMIAAGIGLVALGAALGAASSALQSGSAGSGVGGGGFNIGTAPTASSNVGSAGAGTITLEIGGSGFHLDPRDTRAVDEFAHMLEAVQGRTVGRVKLGTG